MNDSERELVEHIQKNKTNFGELGQYIKVEYIVDFLENKQDSDSYYVYKSDTGSGDRIVKNVSKEKAIAYLAETLKFYKNEEILEYKKGISLSIDDEKQTFYTIGNK